MNQNEPSLVYSVDEAADLLGIGRGAAYEAVKAGEIPSVRIGKLIRIPRAALHKMLENAKGGGAS